MDIPHNILEAATNCKKQKLPHRAPFNPGQCKGIWMAWETVSKKKFAKLIGFSFDRCKDLYTFMNDYKVEKGIDATLDDQDFKMLSKEFNKK